MLQFTIDVRKSYRQPQRTVEHVCEDCMLFDRVDFHVALCEKQHPKCVRAIRLVYPTRLAQKQKSNEVRSGVSNNSMPITIQN